MTSSSSTILTGEDKEDHRNPPSLNEDHRNPPSLNEYHRNSPSLNEDQRNPPLLNEDHRNPPSLEEDPPTHSNHQRRWSSPVDSSGESLHRITVKSREKNSDRGVSKTNLEEFLSISSDSSYSFYLGGNLSPWGPSGPPLLTESRSNGPSPPRLDSRRGRSVTRKEDLPPFLTTLDCNGRPRFHHRRVRSEGRLEIESVAVDSPEIVSVRGREGLRIGTVRISKQERNQDL